MKVKVENVAGAGDGDFEVDEGFPFCLEVGQNRMSYVPKHDGFVIGARKQEARVGRVEEQAVHVLFMSLE